MTIVSFSELFKWQTCQRQYYYRFILGRSPIEESDAISTGVKGHKLLEAFYELLREGKTKEEALKTISDKAKQLVNSDRFADFPLATAWTMVDNYIRETDFSTKSSEFIENRFLLPVSKLTDDSELSHVQIGFTPDLITKRKGDFVDIEDAKFVGRAWGKKKINRFPQIKLYQIFMESMNYKISRTMIRFFNLQTYKITEQPYVTKGVEKETIKRDFLAGVKEVVRFKEGPKELLSLAPRTMNYTACQYCPFEFVCTLEAEGKDASKTLNALYKESSYDYTR